MHQDDRREWQVPVLAGAEIVCPRSWWTRKKPRFHSPLEFSSPTAILDKLSGCRVKHLASGAEVLTVDHDVGSGHESDIRKLSAILATRICPLGITFGSAGILLLSEHDDVFMMGYQTRGLKYVGNGFNEALQSLIEKSGFPCVLIDPKLDPDGIFLPDAKNLQAGIPVMTVEYAAKFDRTVRHTFPPDIE